MDTMDVPASVRVERNLEDLRRELNNKLMFLRNKSSQNSIKTPSKFVEILENGGVAREQSSHAHLNVSSSASRR